MPLPILLRRNIFLADTIIAALGAIMTATMYFLCLYLQQVLGYSALLTGFALAPMSVVLALGAFAAKSALPTFGTSRLIAAGGILMAVGLVWLSIATEHNGDALRILGPTLVWAAGASLVTMPCVALATTGVDAEHAGLAAGLVNTARGTGGALGLAVLVTIADTATTRSDLPDRTARLVDGYSTATLASASIAVLITALGLAARVPFLSDRSGTIGGRDDG